jgi:hypothetical protein
MASTDTANLRARAKHAYELGRLRVAARAAAAVIPMVALSLVACDRPALTFAAGATLLALAVAFRWRGETWGRAVTPGLLAGSVPLLLPLLLRSSGHCCVGGEVCWSACMIGCIGGGILAGAAIGIASAVEKEHRWAFLSAATLLAGFAGMLGCAVVGVAGMAGMALAVVATSLPVAMVARMRTS